MNPDVFLSMSHLGGAEDTQGKPLRKGPDPLSRFGRALTGLKFDIEDQLGSGTDMRLLFDIFVADLGEMKRVLRPLTIGEPDYKEIFRASRANFFKYTAELLLARELLKVQSVLKSSVMSWHKVQALVAQLDPRLRTLTFTGCAHFFDHKLSGEDSFNREFADDEDAIGITIGTRGVRGNGEGLYDTIHVIEPTLFRRHAVFPHDVTPYRGDRVKIYWHPLSADEVRDAGGFIARSVGETLSGDNSYGEHDNNYKPTSRNRSMRVFGR